MLGYGTIVIIGTVICARELTLLHRHNVLNLRVLIVRHNMFGNQFLRVMVGTTPNDFPCIGSRNIGQFDQLALGRRIYIDDVVSSADPALSHAFGKSTGLSGRLLSHPQRRPADSSSVRRASRVLRGRMRLRLGFLAALLLTALVMLLLVWTNM